MTKNELVSEILERLYSSEGIERYTRSQLLDDTEENLLKRLNAIKELERLSKELGFS